MKVLVIVDSIDKNHSSGAKANVALIENLVAIGYSLTIIHQSATDIQIAGASMRWAKPKKASLTYWLSRSQRIFTRVTAWNINPTIERWFGFSFTFFNDVTSFYSVAKNENPANFDWILTLSYASSFRPHAAVLRLPHFHNKWLAYVHDPYPMHSYPRPYDWVEPGHQYKRNFFLKIAKHAKFMLYPSDYLAEWMESYYFDLKGKRIIIPHQISAISPKPYNKELFGTDNEFRILHAGNLMSARNPMAVLHAFAEFLEENKEAAKVSKLIFVGTVAEYFNQMQKVAKTTPQIVVTGNYLEYEVAYSLQNEVSVNIILEAKGAFSPFLPGKFAHCVAANKPILLLSPFYSESRRLLGNDYEYWSEIDNKDKIKALIKSLYLKWLESNNTLKLERKDLHVYLSTQYLKETLENLKH